MICTGANCGVLFIFYVLTALMLVAAKEFRYACSEVVNELNSSTVQNERVDTTRVQTDENRSMEIKGN
jgi:hypothetical protein